MFFPERVRKVSVCCVGMAATFKAFVGQEVTRAACEFLDPTERGFCLQDL